MVISEIYKKYPINKGLQEHMLRVAAVAKMVCGEMKQVDANLVLSACLLHDVGNLAKINFSLPAMDQHFTPEGVEYWKKEQEKMWQEISKDEYTVTEHILRDIGVCEGVIKAVLNIELAKILESTPEQTVEDKIIMYADLRVGLHGIISVEERMNDIKARYVPERYSAEFVDDAKELLLDIEAKLFVDASIVPEDITDASTAEMQKELLNFDIATH